VRCDFDDDRVQGVSIEHWCTDALNTRRGGRVLGAVPPCSNMQTMRHVARLEV